MIFDGCVFDETVFDAVPCAAPATTGGHPGRKRRTRRLPYLKPSVPEPEARDEDAELVLLM